MEYHDLVRERLAEWEREAVALQRASEVRRIFGDTGRPNPLARFDSLVLRASKGAAQREARRELERTTRQTA